jgi:DNA helicase II / ATP-dependent DNA helicase PcrA
MATHAQLVAGLNEEQKEAVEATEGPVLVLAGAGSGKTRVIIHRIAYLLANGVPSSRILAVTFTNKAANEMKERIQKLVGKERASGITISTFHSLGLWMARRSKARLGLRGHVMVMDEADRHAMLRQVRLEMGTTDSDLSLDETEDFLMQVKGCGQIPERYATKFGPKKKILLLRFFDQYTRRLRLAESLDFDDLILLPVNLMESNEKVGKEYRSLFDYILVDEYQDTNMLQFRLLKGLVDERNNLCVVGDDDQSIYGWRGARVENILEFDRVFAGARVIKLTRNYRSERNILQLANALIAQNTVRREKELWTESANEAPALRLRYQNPQEEARDVAERVREMTASEGIPAREIAVLYRTKGQSKQLQENFRIAGIPYKVVGSYDFFERKEVRDILAYLRLACNPHDQASFRRVVNYPARGIGLVTLEKVEAWRENQRSAFSATRAFLENDGSSLPVRTRRALQGFVDLIRRSEEEVQQTKGKALLAFFDSFLDEAGVRDDLIVRGTGTFKVLASVRVLMERGLEAGAFSTLQGFLERITMEQRESDYSKGEGPENLVTLMTVHASKGLEFQAVYIVGMVEGMFPHFRSVGDAAGLEEERRLFYVAITRARKNLFLSSFRQKEERGELRPARPSRFLKELPDELLSSKRAIDSEMVSKDQLLAAFDEFEKGS